MRAGWVESPLQHVAVDYDCFCEISVPSPKFGWTYVDDECLEIHGRSEISRFDPRGDPLPGFLEDFFELTRMPNCGGSAHEDRIVARIHRLFEHSPLG